jgi:hypothetical protein
MNKALSSRRLAQNWSFPKHGTFIKHLRRSAKEWFFEKQFSTHSKMPYCLANLQDWKNNIILDEVSEYVELVEKDCEQSGKPFPLHKYVHHGLSSQAMAFNLIGPLIIRNNYEPLIRLLQKKNIVDAQKVVSAIFEYEDRTVFNEDSGQPTSIDVVLCDETQNPVVFLECKLAEKGFGGCSVFAHGDCNGENPLSNKNQCYLHFIGRKYWDLIEKYKFSENLYKERQCVFVAHYQFFREVLLSLEKGGVFVLLSDERSPVFHCELDGVNRGLMSFLITFVPDALKNRIISISVQELIKEIRHSENHNDWLDEFERKYGLVQVY